MTAYAQQEPGEDGDSGRVPVPTGKYITGGVLGSTIGFGIGHAVQGRYGDKGWIFTAGEAAGLTAMVAGLASCKDETQSDGSKEKKCSQDGLIGLGAAALIGFHIWEIVDAWTGARPVDNMSMILVPDAETPRLGVAFSF